MFKNNFNDNMTSYGQSTNISFLKIKFKKIEYFEIF